MKIENWDMVRDKVGKIQNAMTALNKIDGILTGAESRIARGGELYGLCISEHSDGSGYRVNLSGLDITAPLLEMVREMLKHRITTLKEDLEKL